MMAHAGLAEPSLRLLRAAVADGGTVARFRAKTAVVPGSGCEYWTSAISGRGHGRFRVGEVAGRDVVVIAHRFAWAARQSLLQRTRPSPPQKALSAVRACVLVSSSSGAKSLSARPRRWRRPPGVSRVHRA